MNWEQQWNKELSDSKSETNTSTEDIYVSNSLVGFNIQTYTRMRKVN